MKKDDDRWTREQTIVAFNLYCKIPFRKVTSGNQDIIKVAAAIGRSVNSVKMKIGNFGSFDPELKSRGIVGLANASKLDKEIWDEFNNDWEDLAFQSETILSHVEKNSGPDPFILLDDDFEFSEGIERERLVKTRVNQNFFRQTVLAAYDFSCCVTGIDVRDLLVASHIVPWSKAAKDRLNPRNGLSLNALHDRAFDRGLMTITPDFKVKVSPKILAKQNATIDMWIASFNGREIKKPYRFMPSSEFLEYHNNNIFQS